MSRVQVATVERVLSPVRVETSGTVRAVQRATLAAKVPGPITGRVLALGQPVKAGEVLIEIAAPELSARLAQSRAQLAQVERELARERGLFASGSSTGDAVKSLEDRLAQNQAAVREAESLLAYTQLRAPFDGFVARKFAEPGDYAAAGSPLVHLDGGNAFELDVPVPDSFATTLAVGVELDVDLGLPTGPFRARIAEISSAVDAPARTTTAKLAIPPGLAARPGAFARVAMPGPPVATLRVPVGAVSRLGQIERVFTLTTDQRAALRLVKTGARRGDAIEIVAGLEAGERVIVAAPAALRDGHPVEIMP